MKSFEELDCWKKAAALRRRLSGLAKSFPSEEKFRLTDQLLPASRSVSANLAEGFGRFHHQEYIQYCGQRRGSLYEIIDHLIVACEEIYISEKELREIRNEVNTSLAVINGFINYLIKAKYRDHLKEPQLFYNIDDSGELHTDNG